ncbi:MAG: RtcB family protein [Bacteroidales bacterium]|jgi:tRNA-splicing ligase RtcB|nr:RtcB family protein [Bacteroidales bacterium]
MNLSIRTKDLSKIGYTDNVARSIATIAINKHCKRRIKQEVLAELADVIQNPSGYHGHTVWGRLAEHFCPQEEQETYTCYDLRESSQSFKCYGGKYIDQPARQQMELAMRLPVTIQGALMPDAHAGYGLPIGGVLAVDNAVIPYAVGVDIGCRMSLSIFEECPQHLQRYAHQLKEALKEFTHFGMNGCLGFTQEHEVLDRTEFREIPLLKPLHGKAVRQLGSSGGGNHFVEFGDLELFPDNVLGLPANRYMALLSHSGSRGLGAEIARHYSNIAREKCRLPREAQHFAWLDMQSEEGQEYWQCMNLAGDYAEACHERIHANLSKATGLQKIANVNHHHNFAWKEILPDGRDAIVHRKGATPAHTGEAGIIPGSMTTSGYLICGKGAPEALYSASHGAGRAMSRQKAKESFTRSELKKMLNSAAVTLIGGSVEEASLAYKNIDHVMEAQTALVEVHGRFMPRIVRMNKE